MSASSPDRNDRTARARARGFTLIELLTVMAIIVILMSLIIGAAIFAREASTRAKAKAQMEQICNALQEYKLQKCKFPAPVGPGAVSYSEIEGYLDKKNMFTYTNDFIVDPWRRPYVYSNDSAESYSLYSEGRRLDIVADNIYSGK